MMPHFPGKVGLVQRVLPDYRAPFFDALAEACGQGLGVFAGNPRPDEMIKTTDSLENARLFQGKNLHLFQGPLYLCLQRGLLNWLADWNPDALIVEANPRYLSTPAAVRWMHRRNRPVIGWGLGAPLSSGSPLAALRQWRRERFLMQFDSLITYSQVGASAYAELGYPPDQIHVAVNAMTPRPTHPMPIRPIPSPGKELTVLFVGRLQDRKRLDNLIQACAALPTALQPKLIITGDGPEKEPLANLAQEIYPRTFFTGALYDQVLAEQFRQADLFVLPGTGGLAVQQAMSYGLPIIAAEADGTQNDMVRPQNGWQAPPNDITALKLILQKALSDVEDLRKKGAESYRMVAEEINLEQMVSVFIEALNRSIQ